jgi:hypothetical protein
VTWRFNSAGGNAQSRPNPFGDADHAVFHIGSFRSRIDRFVQDAWRTVFIENQERDG